MKLDKGIRIASEQRSKYKFSEWEVGDSCFCERLEQIESMQNSSYAWAKRQGNGWVFTRRSVEGGYRLWRIA